MVVLKVLKNENMFFKALTMGLGNANAYNVKIDKNVVATLRPGEETEIELPPGSHTVVFKAARSMGVKSNKLTVIPIKEVVILGHYLFCAICI